MIFINYFEFIIKYKWEISFVNQTILYKNKI